MTVTQQAPLPMEFSRQEYWSGLHFLLLGIFPTKGLNPGLLHCRQTLYHLSHQGSPSIYPEKIVMQKDTCILFIATLWTIAMNCSLPGSSVHGILQARILEWVAVSSSKEECHLTNGGSISKEERESQNVLRIGSLMSGGFSKQGLIRH